MQSNRTYKFVVCYYVRRINLSGGMPKRIVTRCQNERRKKYVWTLCIRIALSEFVVVNFVARMCQTDFLVNATLWSSFFFFSHRVRQVLAFSFASVHTKSQLTTYKRQTLCAHSHKFKHQVHCAFQKKKDSIFSIFVNYRPDWMCCVSVNPIHTRTHTPSICCW